MADVFLSYDRGDVGRAKSVASALEKAGHSVWWDRRIKSGAQYSREIDEALKRSDAVVVLWSENSIDSAWVRDEAAAARDSGKLVPARIGPVEPPLGFRQYQTADLTRWKGRGRSPDFEEMLWAISSLMERSGEQADAPAPPAAPGARAKFSWPLVVATAAVALFAIGLLAWSLIGRSSSVPIVAVASADPSAASQALARDLLVKLGNLQAAHSHSIDLVSQEGTAEEPAFTFQVGRSGNGQGTVANLALVKGRNRSVLWADDLRDPNGNEADLKQQLAYTAAHVLGCALESTNSEPERLGSQSLKSYLNACAVLPDASPGEAAELIPGLQQLVQQAPQFAGGWAMFLSARTAALRDPNRPEVSAEREALRNRIAEARKLHPTLAEAYLAEVALAADHEFLRRSRLLDRGIELNPGNTELRSTRAYFLTYVGRMDDAIRDARSAVEIDPLSPSARNSYIMALAFSGRIDEALSELQEAERLWPGATSLKQARFTLHLRVGDPREALRLLRSGALKDTPTHWLRLNEAFLQARINRSPENVQRAVLTAKAAYNDDPRAISGLSQTLVEFGRDEELFQILLNWRRMDIVSWAADVLFRPKFSNFQNDPRFMQVAKRLGLLDFWRATGKWPDFCSRADLPYDCEEEAARIAA